jgi:hypothetical protein
MPKRKRCGSWARSKVSIDLSLVLQPQRKVFQFRAHAFSEISQIGAIASRSLGVPIVLQLQIS